MVAVAFGYFGDKACDAVIEIAAVQFLAGGDYGTFTHLPESFYIGSYRCLGAPAIRTTVIIVIKRCFIFSCWYQSSIHY